MTKGTPVVIPHENVNDESVTLLSWLIAKGERVNQGQRIAEVETSKAVMEIEAPVTGILEYSLEVGSDIEVGGALCYIRSEDSGGFTEVGSPTEKESEIKFPVDGEPLIPSKLPSNHRTEHVDGVETGEIHDRYPTHFSKKAKMLVEQRGLSPDRFSGRGLIRTDDVLRELGELSSLPPMSHSLHKRANKTDISNSAPIPAMDIPFRTEKLSKSKRTEINYLTSGYQNTLPSVISVGIPTNGLRVAVEKNPEVKGNTTAILIFEVARLLRRYPWFNAFYRDGQINFYEEVNVGFAIDAGHGLKVPVVHAADTKGVQEIASEMQELIVSYLENNLSSNSLLGGTFTVTDLSGEGVLSFHPLLNHGQSAILGVGGEFFPPGTQEGFFNLILAFDHQVSEGRQAAKFLGELSQHLQAYEKTLDSNIAKGKKVKDLEKINCIRCLTPLGNMTEWDQFEHWDHFMVQIAQPDGETGYLCSVCLRGW